WIGGPSWSRWLRVTLEHRHNFLLDNAYDSYRLDTKMRAFDICHAAQGCLHACVRHGLFEVFELFLLPVSDDFFHDVCRATTALLRRTTTQSPSNEGCEDLWRSGIHVHLCLISCLTTCLLTTCLLTTCLPTTCLPTTCLPTTCLLTTCLRLLSAKRGQVMIT